MLFAPIGTLQPKTEILEPAAERRSAEPPVELHMKNARFASKVPALAALLLLAACSGSAGGGGGGSLYIESCSLGCGDGSGGNQVACSIDLVGLTLQHGPQILRSLYIESFELGLR